MVFFTKHYLRLSVGFWLAVCLACSGDSSGVADQSALDAEPMLLVDGFIEEPDSMSLAMDANVVADQEMNDLEVTADTGSADAEVSLDQMIQTMVDAAVVEPIDMAEVPTEAWSPRPTPIGAIIPETGDTLELLIVGNNYVGLHELCEKISGLAEGTSRWTDVTCEMVSVGGFRLLDHADCAASVSGMDMPGLEKCDSVQGVLAGLLNAQDPTRTQFDLMILQERAQVSGFPEGQTFRNDFEQATEELAIRAHRLGTKTALLMPWGRPDGDASNVGLYPDFPTMQARIAEAHYAVAEDSSDDTNRVEVIEAGETWFRTYQRNTDGDFSALYLLNDHNPSATGSWLLAAIILKRAFGVEPFDLPIISDLPESGRWLRLRGDIIQR